MRMITDPARPDLDVLRVVDADGRRYMVRPCPAWRSRACNDAQCADGRGSLASGRRLAASPAGPAAVTVRWDT